MRDFKTQLAIDKAAHGERVELLKRAAVTPEQALKESIQSGFDDDDIADKNAWRVEQTKAFNDYVAKSVVAFKKGATEMSTDEILVKVAKVAKDIVEGGAPTEFPKSALYSALRKRAFETRRDGRSDDQAISDCLNGGDEVGKLIFSAMRFAKGPEVEPDGTSDYPPSTVKAPPWAGLGPAHAKLEVLARDHKLKNDRKTIEQARAHVYAHNAALREQCKAEHLAAINKAMAA